MLPSYNSTLLKSTMTKIMLTLYGTNSPWSLIIILMNNNLMKDGRPGIDVYARNHEIYKQSTPNGDCLDCTSQFLIGQNIRKTRPLAKISNRNEWLK